MIVSPLRYPGGKGNLFPFFAELIRENKLYESHYCEPYAGGAGLAIKLLTNGFVSRASINDIDFSIYAFWKSALFNTDQFCGLIENSKVNIDEWHCQKAIWERSDPRNLLRLGFATYFLNRTNRSGIIDGAGPIGGYAQKGKWKVDVRLSKSNQIRNLLELSKFSNQIQVTNLDAVDFLQTVKGNGNALLYLDPPYFIKGHRLYKNFYEPKDHLRISNELRKWRRGRWIVSYDDVPEIRNAYNSFSPISYSLNYSAAVKSVGTEVMFLSDALTAPKVVGFKMNSKNRAKSSPRRHPNETQSKRKNTRLKRRA